MDLSRDTTITGYMDGYTSNTPDQPAKESEYGTDQNSLDVRYNKGGDPPHPQYAERSQEVADNTQSQKYIPRKQKIDMQIPQEGNEEAHRLQDEKDINHTMYNSGVNKAHRDRHVRAMESSYDGPPPAQAYGKDLSNLRFKFLNQKVPSRQL